MTDQLTSFPQTDLFIYIFTFDFVEIHFCTSLVWNDMWVSKYFKELSFFGAELLGLNVLNHKEVWLNLDEWFNLSFLRIHNTPLDYCNIIEVI